MRTSSVQTLIACAMLIAVPLTAATGGLAEEPTDPRTTAEEPFDWILPGPVPGQQTPALAGAYEQAVHLVREATLPAHGFTADVNQVDGLGTQPGQLSQLAEALREGGDTGGLAPGASAAAFDELPSPVAHALADLLQALIVYDRTANHVFEDGSADRASLIDARIHLLEASMAFNEVLQDHPDAAVGGPVHDAHPTIRIDLSGTSRDYTRNYSYIIDVGGSDAYMNNAGGNTFGDCNQTVDAAALFDLNTPGTDAPPEVDYFNTDRTGLWTENACGKNGGAWGPGSGLLVSTEGDDVFGAVYDPRNDIRQSDHAHGINGGGTDGGMGLLVDTAGDDVYRVGGDGTNGGASGANATGLLVDTLGSDVYDAGSAGTNGGALDRAHGGLIDIVGSESYTAGSDGTNGGAVNNATGLLADLDGNDDYRAGANGVNGGAVYAIALLFDGGGADTFQETDTQHNCSDPGSCTTVPKGHLGARIAP